MLKITFNNDSSFQPSSCHLVNFSNIVSECRDGLMKINFEDNK